MLSQPLTMSGAKCTRASHVRASSLLDPSQRALPGTCRERRDASVVLNLSACASRCCALAQGHAAATAVTVIVKSINTEKEMIKENKGRVNY